MRTLDVLPVLRSVGIGAARTVPLALSVPVLGGPAFPLLLRLAIGCGLATLCLPVLVAQPVPEAPWLLVLLLGREALVGLTLGFICACMFRAAEAAGQTVDVLCGANMPELISPTGQGNASPLGIFFLLLAAVTFCEIGGLAALAMALAKSYQALPLDASRMPSTSGMAHLVVLASARLIEAAVGLCAPVLVAMLLADIVMGAMARAAPGLPVSSLGLPLKALLGLGVVLLGTAGLDAALQNGFVAFLRLFTAAGTLRH